MKLPRPDPDGRLVTRLRQAKDTAKLRGGVLVAGGVAVTTAAIGGPATQVSSSLDATPTRDPIPPATANPFDDFALGAGLGVELPPASPTFDTRATDTIDLRRVARPAPRFEVGERTLVMVTDTDDLFGKAEVMHGLLDALLADEANHPLVTSWMDDAQLRARGEVEVDLDALFRLADALEDRGVRPTRAGIDIFRFQRGLPDDAPTANVARHLLTETAGAVHLNVMAAPPAEASQAIRFLRKLDDPSALLGALQIPIAADGAIAVNDAVAITQRAAARGIDLSGDPAATAARLMPIGARPEGEAARYDWYLRLVQSEGFAVRTGPNEVNVVGLRGFDVDGGPGGNAFNDWNDTIAFVWRDGDGVPHAVEFRATTDPGQAWGDAPDVNGDGRGDVAHLRPGQYTYFAGTHRGRATAGNPTVNVPVDRDTNHDGDISNGERAESAQRGDVGYGINIHWGPGYDSGDVGGYSLGCQVVTLDYGAFQAQIAPLLRSNPNVPYTLVELGAEDAGKLG